MASIAIPTIFAYLLIVGYFIVERSLRKTPAALSLDAEECDRGSSRTIQISGSICILLAFIAPVLNAYQIGFWNLGYGCWFGNVLAIAGLVLRFWAAVTLGEFYTRTLKIVDGQEIVDRPPYSVIRHPGYAGISLLEIGAGLALNNWIVSIGILTLGSRSRLYRIQAEEQMLETSLREQYQAYQDRTWRLIPFVY